MKYLLLFAARGGAAGALDDAIVAEAHLYAKVRGSAVTAMRQVVDDPFGTAMPGMRVFDASIEVIASTDDHAAVLDAVAGASARLESIVHADLSGVLVGLDHVVVAGPPTPVRYQYVMRRKIGTTREQYLDHYVHRHAEFGRITPGIERYVQFHVDPEATAPAADLLGFGMHQADSVSELHLASVATFIDALASFNPGADAIEDEERFVDRRNSVMFTSDVLWRS